ncbi:DUF2017 domain-containing protein [Cellulomonas edaphi]|uniref:DUF2017 domain-containing protein n=1 Tax=Cellulomonas edaphi TaxID=3053468 RepID=A0ABT7SAE2_9CELL|nr:DUF2017 domain-containing protein [Cellulomons edaphi]MDM7832583.1 DUF2017 domain-containing protein [Cellulomons edaphi]
MKPFRRARGAYVARLTDDERAVLAAAATDVASMLAADEAPQAGDLLAGLAHDLGRSTARPDDPAVRRLLPDASRDDEELAAEFRRLTQADLRASKSAGLLLLARVLTERPGKRPSEVVVERADARAVASAVTDIRLVIAERLGIRTDEQAEAIYDLDAVPAAARQLVAIYGALSWMQESLVGLMLDDARAGVDVTPQSPPPGEPSG